MPSTENNSIICCWVMISRSSPGEPADQRDEVQQCFREITAAAEILHVDFGHFGSDCRRQLCRQIGIVILPGHEGNDLIERDTGFGGNV